MKKHEPIVWLFFLLLFCGLFLGDGKQTVIEVFGAAATLVLWLFYKYVQTKDSKQLPSILNAPWALMFGSTCLSLIVSDSIGYSLSWLVRLASGYMLYRLFYNLSNEETERNFIQGLLLFVGLTVVGSLLLSIFFPTMALLPGMNLLKISHGHSHLADLLIFIAPLFFWRVSLWKKRAGFIATLLFGLVLLTTRARGAWGVMTLYISMVALPWNKNSPLTLPNRIRAALILLLVFVVGVYVFVTPKYAQKFSYILKKDAITNRLIYWNQAIDGFMNKPVLGSGPGTFALVSVQQQKVPYVSTWFAHSSLLQTAAEQGVVGVAVWGWFIGAHAVYLYRLNRKKRFASPSLMVIFGLGLILLYSLVEFVLDYFVTWMLFWASLGLVVGMDVPKKSKRDAGVLVVLIFLSIFYLTWISSNVLTVLTKRTDLGFYLTPFDSTQTLSYLVNPPPTHLPTVSALKLGVFFHKQNASILFAMSEFERNSTHDKQKALAYAKMAAFAEPQNSKYYSYYFQLLAEDDTPKRLGEEILLLSKAALPKRLHKQIRDLTPYALGLGLYYKDWIIPENPSFKNGFAGLYYRFGISDLRDIDPTEQLLVLARDIYPDMAHLHVELASFYAYIRKDAQQAKEELEYCQRYPSAAAQCRQQQQSVLYSTGEYKDVIW